MTLKRSLFLFNCLKNEFLFYCILCLFTLCARCYSEPPRISVKGVVDGQNVTYHPEQRYEINYDEGLTIILTCIDLTNKSYWLQQKDGLTLFSQNKDDASRRVQIEMKLYKFDSDSKLSCIRVGVGTPPPVSISISLKLKRNSTQKDQISDNEKKSVYIGDEIYTQCKLNSTEKIYSYAVLSDNRIIETQEKYEFNVNKDHDGISFVCSSLETQEEKDTVTKIKRVVEVQNNTQYSPKPIEFVEGQVLSYTCQCKAKDEDNYKIQWIQQKHDTKLFTGSKYDMNANITMTLHPFDDNSTLTCIAFDKSSNKEKYRLTIPLYLNKNLPPLTTAATAQTKHLKIGEYLSRSCESNSTDQQKYIYSVPPDNSIVTATSSHSFYVSERTNGLEYFCIENVHSGYMDERVINNHIIILIKDPAVSYAIFILIATAIGAIMIVGILTFVVFKFVKQKQTQGTLKSQTVNAESRDILTQNVVEQPEPVYAAPDQVIYAELQLQSNARNRDSNQEEGHYAEIIGVMAARK